MQLYFEMTVAMLVINVVNCKRTRLPVSASLVVAATLLVSIAWGLELFGGFEPCELCLAQRTPYYVAIPMALLALIAGRLDHHAHERVLLVVCAALFMWSGAIGAYQAGAEWGLWTGPADCGATKGAVVPVSTVDLLTSLRAVKVVDCTIPQLKVLGLSFAAWNAILALGLSSLAAYGSAATRLAGEK